MWTQEHLDIHSYSLINAPLYDKAYETSFLCLTYYSRMTFLFLFCNIISQFQFSSWRRISLWRNHNVWSPKLPLFLWNSNAELWRSTCIIECESLNAETRKIYTNIFIKCFPGNDFLNFLLINWICNIWTWCIRFGCVESSKYKFDILYQESYMSMNIRVLSYSNVSCHSYYRKLLLVP